MRVAIESPYAGDVERNTAYARAALLDSLNRGEAPFASHLLYTQVLDDKDPGQRKAGIDAGLLWSSGADLVAVYCNLGVSPGMRKAIEVASERAQRVEFRSIDGWKP